MKRFLIIQTAFIGDVILATSMIEEIKRRFPEATIDFVLRKGNEGLLQDNPHIDRVFIWDKKQNKVLNLIKLILATRKQSYEACFCIQRFFNAGLIGALSKARLKVCFHNNPLAFLFGHKIKHQIPHPEGDHFLHEVQRNIQLLAPIDQKSIPTAKDLKPKLYFSAEDENKIKELNLSNYCVLAPSSVWYTKQWHHSKWKELIEKLKLKMTVVLIGATSDNSFIEQLYEPDPYIINLAGKLSLKQSALLMKNAKRVFVNDSAPLHLASAVNAKISAIFCSTVPEFGYFPLSDESVLIQRERLDCMPCGLHGKKDCPKVHFKCALDIETNDVIQKSSLE